MVLSLAAVALVAAACSSSSPTAAKKKSHHDDGVHHDIGDRAAHDVDNGGGATATTAAAVAHTATTAPKASATACSTTGGALSAACDTQSPSFKLAGAGANSIQPFFTRVFYDYSQANKGVSVNYSPAGSSVGVTDIQQNTVNFGDSEIPIKTPATGTAGNILQVPVDLGGVASATTCPGSRAG